MQTDCPLSTVLLGVIQCATVQEVSDMEKDVHRRFAEFRTHGEWFKGVPQITAYIQEHFDKALGEQILCEDKEHLQKKDRGRLREYIRKRRQEDAGFRKREQEYRKERYQNDPEYREKQRTHAQERYQNDPEYRKREQKRIREYLRVSRAKKRAGQIDRQLTLF